MRGVAGAAGAPDRLAPEIPLAPHARRHRGLVAEELRRQESASDAEAVQGRAELLGDHAGVVDLGRR